ncbi:MAG: hypothetical protein B7Y36_09050 [Novosphingobium sp. 28-62-57]|uniref:DUF3429 domain-containing protein n=1 Tax=unclassified Novosphingobium TaxID=2644732 RepID=UPI000BDB82BA|nr:MULTISPECIES: DUF3429 domain-containing protein [unclassified Novosphingobium]OYW51251.1 MAG: hypothetical protein B7Z34_00080 [Novosphingobium sp. 12-62-10]OYZ10368.1 MAG: hypothetical protein B7Y36_09050 [Novosphingobium sp. 28-62-57]OZA38663.1 MAG: hypothetical protein B7X92_03510 [Novosphingobium sp. 17-62-9]HQS68090.1 DUF3429 domain-containing protein [Novosphingobium sp.]
MFRFNLPFPVVLLGLAGWLPQAICVWLVIGGGPLGWSALAAGCFYAALILSFLGGLWWMAGLLGGVRSGGLYVIAVLPSLVAWATLLPWIAGWHWPGPSLVVLGLILLASPAVDVKLARAVTLPPDWLRLRMWMATGLGLLTLALAAVG